MIREFKVTMTRKSKIPAYLLRVGDVIEWENYHKDRYLIQDITMQSDDEYLEIDLINISSSKEFRALQYGANICSWKVVGRGEIIEPKIITRT